jgi:hypothetical protein
MSINRGQGKMMEIIDPYLGAKWKDSPHPYS